MHIARENNNFLIQINNKCKHKIMKSLCDTSTILENPNQITMSKNYKVFTLTITAAHMHHMDYWGSKPPHFRSEGENLSTRIEQK